MQLLGNQHLEFLCVSLACKSGSNQVDDWCRSLKVYQKCFQRILKLLLEGLMTWQNFPICMNLEFCKTWPLDMNSMKSMWAMLLFIFPWDILICWSNCLEIIFWCNTWNYLSQTYTGNILIAINPFQRLPHLYDTHMMEQYKGAALGELSPHVFAVADVAYRLIKIHLLNVTVFLFTCGVVSYLTCCLR